MSKFKEIKKILGLNIDKFDDKILFRLLEFNSIEGIYNKVNKKYPDNYLYAQSIIDMERIINKYEKILG